MGETKTKGSSSSPALLRWVGWLDEAGGGWAGIICGALAFVIPVILYLLTAMREPAVNGDYAEFSVIGVVWGIPHPTGFPLYLILNGLVSLLPIGTHAFRIAAMSSVFVAASSYLAYRIARSCRLTPIISLGVILLVATGRSIWFQGIIPEVYGLHMLLTVATVWALFKWEDSGDDRWFLASLWIYILGLGNHPGSIFALPGLLIFPLMFKPRIFLKASTWLHVLGAVLVLLSLYAYVFLRSFYHPAIADGQIDGNFQRFWFYITGQEYRSAVATYDFRGKLVILKLSVRFARSTLTRFGLACAILGIIPAFSKSRKRLLTLLLVPAGFFISIMIFPAVEPESYLAPGFLFAGVLIGYLIAALTDLSEKYLPARAAYNGNRGPTLVAVALICLMVGIVNHVQFNLGQLDFSKPSIQYHQAERIVKAVESNSLVFSTTYRFTMMMKYAEFADRVRGNDTSVTFPQAWNLEEARKALSEGRHVYIYPELVEQVTGQFALVPLQTGTAQPEAYELLPANKP